MAVYKNIKIFDYYEVNRAARSELVAQELLEMIMQEKDISLVSGSTVVGYVQEKKQVGRTVRADVYVSPNYIAETAAENYRIREYEIIRGAGGDMVCLHIEPLGEEPSFWEKLKFRLTKKQPKVDGVEPTLSDK